LRLGVSPRQAIHVHASASPIIRKSTHPAIACLLGVLAAGCAPQAPRTEPAPAKSACVPAPLATTLFLRGSITTWALRDDMAFQYACDAYVLNVDASGPHEFRITDAQSRPAFSFGAAASGGAIAVGTPTAVVRGSDVAHLENLRFTFSGAQTIRLRFATGADGAAAPTVTIGPRDFVDPAGAPIDDAVARSLAFDSRSTDDKAPFGAVTAGSDVAFSLAALPGVSAATLIVEKRRLEGPQEILEYHEVARIALTRDAGSGGRERWSGRYRFDDIGVYGYYFEMDVGARRFLYQNNADPIYWTRELGSNGVGVATAAGDPQRVRRFRQSVYRSDYRVPAWASDAVFYYIFPERFRNGDRRNDPKPGPHTFHDQSVEAHANWLDAPWRPRSGDGSDDAYGNDFFGGDLAGITGKLDYIAGLGANALYLTPIFRAASNHKYDTADYRHIDPHFGSDAEFATLTREARRRGIRVLLDTSLNHSGSDSVYFDRYAKYPQLGAFDGGRIQPQSPYADWYLFDPAQSDPERQYRGWNGSRDLPELNKASPSFRAFAFGAQDSIMKRWLDRGAAGWRMDVAPWVPDDFWREWRSAVKAHRPDALTVCETQFDSSKFLLGDEFDSTMNYVFRDAVEDYANGKDARTVYRAIELIREEYPPQAFFALMNLLSTHDTPRALFDFGYHGADDDAATIDLAKRRLRLAVFFQMVFPGAPAVFYGDEVGATGAGDPYNRVTYPWRDLGGRPDQSLLADYKRLIALRREHAVLRHGTIDAPAFIDDHVIVLLRRDGARWAVTAMNNDTSEHSVRFEVPAAFAGATLSDALTGARTRVAGTTLTLSVPALFGSVLEKR
jgi:glycosidase